VKNSNIFTKSKSTVFIKVKYAYVNQYNTRLYFALEYPDNIIKAYVADKFIVRMYGKKYAPTDILIHPIKMRLDTFLREQVIIPQEYLDNFKVTEEGTPSSHWSKEGSEDPHKGHYDKERNSLTLGTYTDDELANGAFMNYDVRPSVDDLISGKRFSPIVWMTAVKERIRWLSRALEKEKKRADQNEADASKWRQLLTEQEAGKQNKLDVLIEHFEQSAKKDKHCV
jgi:hypothetical protein